MVYATERTLCRAMQTQTCSSIRKREYYKYASRVLSLNYRASAVESRCAWIILKSTSGKTKLGSGSGDEAKRTRNETERNWPALRKKKKKETGKNYALLRARTRVNTHIVFLADECNLINETENSRDGAGKGRSVCKEVGRIVDARARVCCNDLTRVFLTWKSAALRACVRAKFILLHTIDVG